MKAWEKAGKPVEKSKNRQQMKFTNFILQAAVALPDCCLYQVAKLNLKARNI